VRGVSYFGSPYEMAGLGFEADDDLTGLLELPLDADE
jgi:hypothetical protein